MWTALKFIYTFAIINSASSQTIFENKNLSRLLNIIVNPIVKIINSIANLLPEAKYTNSTEYITSYGYKAEEHTVISSGYSLTMFRIVGTGPSVYIFHGILTSSDDWFTLGEQSLPVYLASLGYDVWLGNSRGNTYSRKHTILLPSNPLFWDFSWHEIGAEDLPVSIDYICKTAGVAKISYIGHSQGTTSAYVMLSDKPEYNEKLHGVISLSSVAYMSQLKSPIFQLLSEYRTDVEAAFKALNIYELFPHQPPSSTVTSICASSKILTVLCLTFSYTLSGFNYDQIDYNYTSLQLAQSPAGSSLKQATHYLQNVKSGDFQKYDHGAILNLIRYGSTTAPSYVVERITTKLSIIYGAGDWLSNFEDIKIFMGRLPTTPEVYRVAHPSWNHMDYLWGKDAHALVYITVENIVNKYNS